MKKILVVLLILAVAGGAFAQSLTFTGDIWSGLNLVIVEDSQTDPRLGTSNREGSGTRLNLTGTYRNEEGTAGARFQLRTDFPGHSGGGLTGAEFAYGWLQFGGGMTTVYGGRLDQSGFATMGGVDTNLGIHSRTGIRVDIVPVDGLSVGLGLFAYDRPAADRGHQMSLHNAKFNLGVNYLMPDLLRVVVGFTTTNWGIPGVSDPPTHPASWGPHSTNPDRHFGHLDMRFAFGVNYLGLAGSGVTTLALDTEIGGINYFDKGGWVTIGQRVQYAGPNDIEVGARAVQRIPVLDDQDLGASVAVWVNYLGLGNIVPHLGVGFDLGSKMGSIANGSRFVWDSLGKDGFDSDDMNIVLRPAVELRVSSTQWIEIGYQGQFGIDNRSGGKNKMNNNIFANFRVGF